MNRKEGGWLAAALLCLPLGWFVPEALAGDDPGFVAVCLLTALRETLLFGLLALLLYLRSAQSRERLRALMKKPDSLPAGLTLLSAVSFTMAGLLVTLVAWYLLQSLGLPAEPPPAPLPAGFRETALAALCMALVPAVCEELLFRGVMLGALMKRMKPGAAALASAAVFAALHQSLLAFPVLLVIGLTLARLRISRGGLVLPMMFHGMYNFSVLLLNASGASPGFGLMLLCAALFALTARLLLKEERDGTAGFGL